MVNELLSKCPVCGEKLRVTELKCGECNITINCDFSLAKFSRLTDSQLHFIEVFIKARGNIKEVEKEMGISYPTVRNKLDEVIKTMGYENGGSIDNKVVADNKEARKEILDALEKGNIDSEEAIKSLKNL